MTNQEIFNKVKPEEGLGPDEALGLFIFRQTGQEVPLQTIQAYLIEEIRHKWNAYMSSRLILLNEDTKDSNQGHTN